MLQVLDLLSREGYQPHGFCMMWEPGVFWTHVVADLVIALAYVSIPAALVVLYLRRPDLMPRRIAALFAAFILACGATHVMGVWTMWVPDYRLEAGIKAVTAGVSAATALALWPLIPRILALPSIRAFQEKNAALEAEIADRQRRDAEVRRLNAELSEALEAEKHLNGLQRQFVAMVSHELRTPMAIIDGKARQIQRGGARLDQAAIEERAADIRRAVQRLTQLTDSVLQSSRFEDGHIDFTPETVDLAALVADARDGAVDLLGDHTITADIDPELTTVHCDPTLMRQVLYNMISNAARYSDPGAPIRIEARRDGLRGVARISVVDRGVGIPAAEVDRLFTRFFRASTSVGRPGAGIGLHLIKHFVKLHGGAVSVRSVVDEGSTFTVEIPLQAAAAAA